MREGVGSLRLWICGKAFWKSLYTNGSRYDPGLTRAFTRYPDMQLGQLSGYASRDQVLKPSPILYTQAATKDRGKPPNYKRSLAGKTHTKLLPRTGPESESLRKRKKVQIAALGKHNRISARRSFSKIFFLLLIIPYINKFRVKRRLLYFILLWHSNPHERRPIYMGNCRVHKAISPLPDTPSILCVTKRCLRSRFSKKEKGVLVVSRSK